MKKYLSILLAMALLLTCIPLGAVSVSAATYGDLTYTISGGKVTITDCDIFASGALTIPATIEGYPVTTIGTDAFYWCDSLTSVTIPDSVTSIGYEAFYFCTSLTTVTIGDSVTTIGNYAFSGCHSLTSVTIPDSVTTIGDFAFYFCTGLTEVTIPDSVTTIGNRAFSGCKSLTSITVSTENPNYSSVDGILFNKDKTTLIQCPGGKTGAYTIPDSVTSIGEYAFAWYESLTEVTIPDGVTTIGYRAFYDCTSLTAVTIGDSVTTIGDEAFWGCDSLTDVYYTGSEIDRAAISVGYHNSCLTNATWHYANPSGQCGADATWIYYADEKKLVISGTGTVSGDWRSLSPRYVIIEEGITGVGDTCFASTYGDVYVLVIPSTLTSVGNESFMCGARTVILNSAIIAANASTYDSVGYLFFQNTTTLVNASISKKGSYISGSYTDSVTVNGTAYRMYSDHEHEYRKVTSDDFSGAQCASCYMPKDVFADAGNFIYTLSNGKITITGVYESASELIIPSTIGGYPVTTIGNYAFYDCTGLTSVTIPDSVTSIGSYAFYDCTGLTDVYYTGTETDRAALSIGSNNFYLTNATWHYTCQHAYMYPCDTTCMNCGELTNPDAAHNTSKVDAVEATCQQTGNVEYWTCADCGYAWLDEACTIVANQFSVIVPMIDHTYDNVYDADCNACGDIREVSFSITFGGNSFSADVNGLAFKFDVAVEGMAVVRGTVADYTNATVNYLGTDCKLVGMGAVLTNSAAIGEDTTALTLDSVNGVNVVDIPAVYLCNREPDSCAFAVRVIDIPAEQLTRTIYARPYYIVEVDGELITVYGNINAASCAQFL